MSQRTAVDVRNRPYRPPPDGQMEPMDKHNRNLLARVHPPDWVNPTPDGRYNMVVIGAGTAGLVTAAGAAGLGAKVALIEKHLLGGDCLNVGCVPSKCLIRSAQAAASVREAGSFSVHVGGGVEVDFPAVMQRLRRLRSRIGQHDSARRFRDLGVDVYLGRARFTGRDAVEVDGQGLQFSKACIATGARAVRPAIKGLAQAGFYTNETIFSVSERPGRLAVIGGGPLGCEMAQAFARLGSHVTLIEKADHLLPREDTEAAAIVAESFRRDGITVRPRTRLQRVSLSGKKKILHLTCDGAGEKLAADEILVGAGRAPNVEELNLGAAGVEYDPRRGIHVDDHLRTSNKNIYAAGDVCMRYKFTHAADAAARIVIQNALFWGRKKLSAATIPWCTYTDPAVAHVGMYEQDARQRGIEVDTFTRRFGDVDRAITDGEEAGFVKVHVRKGTDSILGATLVARHAGDMISEITLAMVTKVGLRTLANVVHPYPTQAEAIKQIADAYNRTRLTPRAKKLFTRILEHRR